MSCGRRPFAGPELPATVVQLLHEAGFEDQVQSSPAPTSQASGAPQAISEQQAITLAVAQVNGPLWLVSATSGPLATVTRDQPDVPPYLDPARLVWFVRFAFADPNFCISTPLGQERCRDMSGTTFVLLDYQTGTFLTSGVSAVPE